MSWTAPFTAVANSSFTAAQFNTYVRDNFNETPAAKATTLGSYFATSATNQISERIAQTSTVTGAETTSSTSYTSLTTPGPAVTVTTGVAALVLIHSECANNGTGGSRASYAVSGASTSAATDAHCVFFGGVATTGVGADCTVWETALTPGSNTFTMQYRVSGNTGTFTNRRITVLPY